MSLLNVAVFSTVADFLLPVLAVLLLMIRDIPIVPAADVISDLNSVTHVSCPSTSLLLQASLLLLASILCL